MNVFVFDICLLEGIVNEIFYEEISYWFWKFDSVKYY